MSQKQSGVSRKNFVQTSAAIAGTAIASNVVHGAENDTEIKIALIGCGGRGTGAAIQAMNVRKGIKVVAVADAFIEKAKGTLNRIKNHKGDQVDVPESRIYGGFDAYKKAIDESGCDMVILTTPPGFRPIHFEYAVEKGKHVFMEKPVAVDAVGVRKVLTATEEAKKKKLGVAVGLQRRHEPQYIEIIKRLQDGAIGDINYTRSFWNSGGVWTRPRKAGQTEMQYQMQNWYYFNWLCGDHIAEQHIHNLDVINWLKNAYPVKASGQGGRQVRISPEHGEIFDHHFVEFEYADGSRMYSQCRHIRGCVNTVNEFAYGSKGESNIGRQFIKGAEKWRYKGPRKGGHQQEWFDFIASLDKGEIPNEGEYGAKSTMTAVLGRMATYSGKTIEWDKAINSNQDLAPAQYSWDAMPKPKKDPKTGLYPCALPGISKPYPV